jgi:hypothetical protein
MSFKGGQQMATPAKNKKPPDKEAFLWFMET